MGKYMNIHTCCDLLSIYSVASDNNNPNTGEGKHEPVVICFQFIL